MIFFFEHLWISLLRTFVGLLVEAKLLLRIKIDFDNKMVGEFEKCPTLPAVSFVFCQVRQFSEASLDIGQKW